MYWRKKSKDELDFVEVKPKIIEITEKISVYVIVRHNDPNTIPMHLKYNGDSYMVVFTRMELADQFFELTDTSLFEPETLYSFISYDIDTTGINVILGDYAYIYKDDDRYHYIDTNKEFKWENGYLDSSFVIHHVMPDDNERGLKDHNLAFYTDMHTHGCGKYDHLELQIVYNKDPNRSSKLLNTFYSLIELGIQIQPGNTIGSYSFASFPDHTIPDKNVLRIIQADPNGKFPWEEGCEEEYKLQMEDMW